MTRRDRLALTLLKPINPSLIIVLGTYALLWGLWVGNPFWTVFAQAPLYSVLEHLGSEMFWGAAAVCSGLVTMRGAIKPSYKNLQWGSFAAFLLWFAVGILYFAGDWMNTGGITSMTFAVYAALVWLNVKVNKEHFIA